MSGKRPVDPLTRLLTWSAVLLAMALFLEVRGPLKGWFRRLTGTAVATDRTIGPPSTRVESEDHATSDTGAVALPPADEAAEAPAKNDLELLYDSFYERYLSRLKKPELGAQYDFKLRNGETVSGKLDAIAQGAVVVEVDYGKMTLPLDRIKRSEYHKLFPEQAAKFLALRATNRELARRKRGAEQPNVAPREAPESVTAAEPEAVAEASLEPFEADHDETIVRDLARPELGGSFKYDASPAKTPDDMRNAVTAFGTWLEYQHRRLGARMATRVYGKRHGRRAALYLVVNELFTMQDYDWRFQMADSLWKKWSMNAQASARLPSLNDAHLVLVDETGRIIGGSSPDDGAEIWVNEK